MKNRQFFICCFVLLLFAAVGVIFANAAVKQRNHANFLGQFGEEVEGKILHVSNMRSARNVEYSYVVLGRTYDQTGLAKNLNGRGKGDSIFVHYLPSNPIDSVVDIEGINSDSAGMIQFSIAWFVILGLFFAAIVAINRQSPAKP